MAGKDAGEYGLDHYRFAAKSQSNHFALSWLQRDPLGSTDVESRK